ncbi:bifunctional UDP-2,4-diacetamido-2,4,6-trideoxy-beta-L-altropyranose hydrolase/GNAT family N-acetyltransferase [Vibrio ostreicida]|uniref:bifunctional UDP-2,4-diacetamido-2,4,6-trideoxy-beta-L-altropyranose hydrolase/GNAT family N-acetyltransferase n=1 Tax=Vibrio ostreicida TaxID=526588 RepID=UPI001FE87193|nr:bifunctional UDP-2,4-diacetamido-2,4,6-trideoxy-beta-L-altropyranose hydrolase/GNAT family N-acetyltransferase [Vibrio ostreicida]
MLRHDVAIGAPGTTCWERACLGLPSILIPLADNQKTICSQLIEYYAAVKVCLNEIESKLLGKYEYLLENWKAFSKTSFERCDGQGVNRLMLEMKQLAEIRPTDFKFRLASDADIETVYQWQFHPRTCQYTASPEIRSWESYNVWMRKKLESTINYFYIILDNNSDQKLGVVRLDYLEFEAYLVSIFLSPDCYGKVVATSALSLIDKLHPDLTLKAIVFEGNVDSQNLFNNAHYVKIDTDNFERKPI